MPHVVIVSILSNLFAEKRPTIPQGTSTGWYRNCSLNYDRFVCTTQWYDYCLYVFLDVQSLLQPPFCVCHSCKEEKEQVKEKKEEGEKEQKWWVC